MTEDSELTSYDSIDYENYSAHIERPESWNNLYERPYMLKQLGELDGKNVLDLGCASGYYAKYALENGARVTGVDVSQAMLDRLASWLSSPDLRLVRADISQPMPFLESNSFDYVICSLVLHYIRDWGPLLDEIYRVMKKGGRLIISTHHPLATYGILQPRSYFDFELVEDTWGKASGHPFKVRHYIRPLKDVLRPIVRSQFRIISIDELLPDENCRKIAPGEYERLSRKPSFLFFILEK